MGMTIAKKINIGFIIKCIFILIIVIAFSNNVFGEINEGYSTETITSTWLNDIFKDSILAAPIGTLLIWIAGFIQSILVFVSIVVSGQETTIMPWADAILFNAVPVLDVNFISPNAASLMSGLTMIIRKIYYTVLTLTIAFTSIAILLSAIKLAVTSIAGEKARYKTALANAALALLLLFTVHYLISFVFFLNESLVKIAAEITTKAVGDTPILTEKEENEIFNVIIKDTKQYIPNEAEKQRFLSRFEGNKKFYILISTEDPSILKEKVFKYEISVPIIGQIHVDKEYGLRRLYEFYDLVTKSSDSEIEKLKAAKNNDEKRDILIALAEKYTTGDKKIFLFDLRLNTPNPPPGGVGVNTAILNSKLVEYLPDLIIKYRENHKSIASNNPIYPIANLAEYFRINCTTAKDNSFVRDKIVLPNCIMYVIFVFQSALYFITYFKRLFYVVILSVMAPAVIVWDFVHKI